ncbi:hypothetical protein ESCOCP365M1_22655 [Escherichia coli]
MVAVAAIAMATKPACRVVEHGVGGTVKGAGLPWRRGFQLRQRLLAIVFRIDGHRGEGVHAAFFQGDIKWPEIPLLKGEKVDGFTARPLLRFDMHRAAIPETDDGVEGVLFVQIAQPEGKIFHRAGVVQRRLFCGIPGVSGIKADLLHFAVAVLQPGRQTCKAGAHRSL